MTEIPSGGMRMGHREVTRLLAAVLGEDTAPLDLVVARLHEADSAQWVVHALAGRGTVLGTASAGKADFVRWKDEAKASFARASGDPLMVTVTFLDYAVSIAAALDRGHGLISSISAAEIASMIERIGPLLPGEWRDLFARARARI